MSVAFTTITRGMAYQVAEPILNEIQLAKIERGMVFGEYNVWDVTEWYFESDIVSYDGQIWTCSVCYNSGNTPEEGDWWTEDNWFMGVWENDFEYYAEEIVSYDGKFWESLADENLGNTPEEGAWWTESNLPAWNAGTNYVEGDVVSYGGGLWESYEPFNIGNTPSAGSEYWTSSTLVSSGITIKEFLEDNQSWLEDYCGSFINHVSGPLNAGSTDFLTFTLATWRSAAGLNANGFRRVREWDGISAPVYEYGLMQRGDIIGPWLFEDLQKGLSALRWTYSSGGAITEGKSVTREKWGMPNSVPHGGTTIYDDVLALGATDWGNANWETGGSNYAFGITSFSNWYMYWYEGGGYWGTYGHNYVKCTASRYRNKATITPESSVLHNSVNLYLYLTGANYDSIADVEDGKWKFNDSFSGQASYESNWIGNIETWPWDLISPQYPDDPSGSGTHADPWTWSWRYAKDCSIITSWLLKWDFTNQ